jgi:type IV secretion system protein VirB1
MNLALPIVAALAQQCAPGIAPEALLSVVSVESRLDPLAINVNRIGRFHAETSAKAVMLATRWMNAGYSVDLGLAQINSHNLEWTGLSVEEAFKPCANLAAAQKILRQDFARASHGSTGLEAIGRTFSLYNSGSSTAGFRNDYVARVWHAAGLLLPRLQGIGLAAAPSVRASGSVSPSARTSVPSFVFGQADVPELVFKGRRARCAGGLKRRCADGPGSAMPVSLL